MIRVRLLLGVMLALGVCGLVLAEAVPLTIAKGKIDKVDAKSITITPRGADGKFEKAITLKLTGTSTFSMIGTRKTKGKTSFTQKEEKAKNLKAKQVIAFVYTGEGADATLLSAVVQPSDEK